MSEAKRIGRPPASWVHQLVKLQFDNSWTDAYEIAARLELNIRTVKSFFQKLPIKPKHEIMNGVARARFKPSDLKRAAKTYLEQWL